MKLLSGQRKIALARPRCPMKYKIPAGYHTFAGMKIDGRYGKLIYNVVLDSFKIGVVLKLFL